MIALRSLTRPLLAFMPIAGALLLHACSGGGTTALPTSDGQRQIQVVQQQPTSQIIKFPLTTAGAGPNDIAVGSDANFWVTEGLAGKIARVTNVGAVSEFAYSLSHSPSFVTMGGGQPFAVWAVDSQHAVVSGVSTTGVPTEVPLPGGSLPKAIFVDASADVWITETGTNTIAETNNGLFTKKPPKFSYFALPAGSGPASVVQGPDKNIWITEPGIGAIAQIAHGSGGVTQYPLPAGRTPTTIVSMDGYLWFGESSSSGTAYLARMTTAGVLTEYPTPGNVVPQYLAAGPLSAIWFCTSASQLAYAVVSTKVTFAPAVAKLSGPEPIAWGKDNNIWFPDAANNSVDVYVVYPMTVTASSIAFTAVAQTQTFAVSETHFSGNFIAVSSNPSVVTVSPSSGKSFTATANAPGTATITVSDNSGYPKIGNGTAISVTVTTTSVSIN